MSTLFTHDCAACVALGQHAGHDLYYCGQGGNLPTVIARYGNKGWEYHSGMSLVPYEPALAEAKRRAETLGLL